MDMNLCVDLILPPHASTFEELIGDFGGRIRLRKNLAIAINLSFCFICLWCTEIFCSAHRLFVRSGDALICAPESFFEEICLLPIFVERERSLTISTETILLIRIHEVLKCDATDVVDKGTALVIRECPTKRFLGELLRFICNGKIRITKRLTLSILVPPVIG